MSNKERPLSPHLSVYRWPITMSLSILHRITGVALSVGLLLLMFWLVAASSGDAMYAGFVALVDTLVGRVLLAAWSFAFFYHLANGVRHLFWDAGFGFERSQADASAWAVLVITVILTLAYWLAV